MGEWGAASEAERRVPQRLISFDLSFPEGVWEWLNLKEHALKEQYVNASLSFTIPWASNGAGWASEA